MSFMAQIKKEQKRKHTVFYASKIIFFCVFSYYPNNWIAQWMWMHGITHIEIHKRKKNKK